MSRIKIKNFGPIKDGYLGDNGWIDIKKVVVFIGNQGSGKSTVAKLITTFMWIEKALTRGDYEPKYFSRKSKFRNQFLKYFRLENYFPDSDNHNQAYIVYEGESYHIRFQNGILSIENAPQSNYQLPQIMYVPAERNFIANVKKPKVLNLTSDSLVEFVTEFDNAKNEIKGAIRLPINEVDVEYNKQHDIVYIKRGSDYRIKLIEASSGFQSLVPLYLVSWYLANSVKKQSENSKELMTSEQRERFRKYAQNISNNKDLTEEQKRIAISGEAKKFNKTAFFNIVEEPEQNLFPSSQQHMLNSLLEFNNLSEGNKLIITTHSPYLINYLTLAVKAYDVSMKFKPNQFNYKATINLNDIVPVESIVNSEDLAIYELDEKSGTIIKLADYKGLPSDENYLNNSLANSNEAFAKLLDIQQSL